MTDHTNAIPEHVRHNFDTLVAAAKAGRLALMQATENANGEAAYLIVAVSDVEDDVPGAVDLVPLAAMEANDPYTRYSPPEGVDVDTVPATA